VLVVDDDRGMCELLEERLRNRGYSVKTLTVPAEALDLVRTQDFDVVVTDVNMRGMNGLDLCRQLIESRPNLPVIIITAFGSLDTAILAIRAGAYDFIPKPFEIDQLVLAIERGVTLAGLKEEVRRLELAVAETQRLGDILGQSPQMRELYGLLSRIADSDAPVLITGESGTGKELVARALHAKGPRAKGPFVAVNCAAMPEPLLESELFGHTKGAFTDAKTAKTGLFAAAGGGTIFLDEIGELPLGLQPKLLRALQERTVRPIGGTAEIPFDARVIAATNRDLESMIEDNRFREDLYFRVNVLQVELPPLRARGGDILLLAQHFLERIATRARKNIVGISPEAAQKLSAYSWPGNVRELQNCMERAVALASFDRIAVGDLPDRIRAFQSTQLVLSNDDPSAILPLDEVERRYVTRVLEGVAGNKSAAARLLGIERKTLSRMLERWKHSDRPSKE
jgi:DNA-binding NtrC family response regulator